LTDDRRQPLAERLPEFPWDALASYAEKARLHPDGVVDLSIGTPVDPTPELARQTLAAASDAHGYPQTYGTPALRDAVVAWFARRRGVHDLDPAGVLPTIGSKELVATLPWWLGLGPGDAVVHPEIAYPTYDISARAVGAEPFPSDSVVRLGPAGRLPGSGARVRLIWVNSPGNPHGKVLGVEHLAKVVQWARARGVVVASDECYAELGWETKDVPSLLDPRVCAGSHEGLLVAYSLSKQSNLAGYRAAFLAGDPQLVASILAARKHIGMMMPWPVQETMRVLLSDDEHVVLQKRRYAQRRIVARAALEASGCQIDHSEAGLYLWVSRGESCWDTVAWFAERGVLVAPGAFYGVAGEQHVRVALTASDERIQALAARVTTAG
jgi:succinyldiaminopimelate transaminase